MNLKTLKFKTLSAAQACQLLQEKKPACVDIRDLQSFQQGHILGAQHLDDASMRAIIKQQDKQKPIIVYCYHGISSQAVAELLASQGFAEVYSLEGGFELFKVRHPQYCE